MKNGLRCIAVAMFLAIPNVRAQEPAKPGPEHEMLKKHVGTWDTTMSMGGVESKGVATYKMELGGLWLVSTFEGEVGGAKYTGKGLDSYDANKKKYVGVWVDSMSASPMNFEGTLDKEKKTLTMMGEGTGMDGKTEKFKSVTEWKDDNTVNFSMYMGSGKDPAFTILYKRKK